MIQSRGRTFLIVTALSLSTCVWLVGSESRPGTEPEPSRLPSANSEEDAGRWRVKEDGAVRSITPRSADIRKDGRNDSGFVEQDHGYYKSRYFPSYQIPKGPWENTKGENFKNVVNSGLLGNGERTKAVRLSFAFPFYGHPVRNLSIASEGFLSMGSLLVSSLAPTQYIAPLMANFAVSKDRSSVVRYWDNGTCFTAEWSKVKLKGNDEGGRFSFLVTLFKDGRIAYFYKEIPSPVERIDDSSYPVKVGISDAYTVDVLLFPIANIHRKTIYEYDTIDLDLAKVKNGSSFLLSPLPTCTEFSDCQSCISATIGFQCRWCSSLQRCSDGGKDRNKQQWVDARCDEQSANIVCEVQKTTTTPAPTPPEVLLDEPVLVQDNLTDASTKAESAPLPPQETTSKSGRRQNVLDFLDDKLFPVKDEMDGSTKGNDDKSQRTSMKTHSRYLETEVIIGILISVVVMVIAIAWFIHAYSRRSSPELVVVEWRGPDVVKS